MVETFAPTETSVFAQITEHQHEQVVFCHDHKTGLPESMGGSGDPSPVTAYGTYMGMKAAAKKAFGSESLTGMRIAVQGVGRVKMTY